MKLPRLRTILLAPLALFVLFYLTLVVVVLFDAESIDALKTADPGHATIAIFGASGTAGDGILKAALADPAVKAIRVVTRRSTPRIAAGADTGKVQVTHHLDYLDYADVIEKLTDVDAVYWAIGTSSMGVDEETYAKIHVDFPMAFVREWLDASQKTSISFHYISSSDIAGDATAMWAREKYRAEQSLFALANGTKLDVIAYRPDYIGPTEQESHVGQELLYAFFAPVMAAVRAEQIGEAMLEITARRNEFANGDRVSTRRIRLYSDAYRRRVSADE